MQEKRFSYYDIEQFLREAGAGRINEKAIKSFEEELKDTVSELVERAEVYANHAGRTRMVTNSDIDMAVSCGARRAPIPKPRRRIRLKSGNDRKRRESPVLNASDFITVPILQARGKI